MHRARTGAGRVAEPEIPVCGEGDRERVAVQFARRRRVAGVDEPEVCVAAHLRVGGKLKARSGGCDVDARTVAPRALSVWSLARDPEQRRAVEARHVVCAAILHVNDGSLRQCVRNAGLHDAGFDGESSDFRKAPHQDKSSRTVLDNLGGSREA